jgi:hypothetical protein
MFEIPKQRGILILVSILTINNLIRKCNGQVKSCYVGETFINNIGSTLTYECSNIGNSPACLVSFK